jgi:hypothetical protein
MLLRPRRSAGLAKAGGDDALIDLVLACHERIRRFTAMAVALTEPAALTRPPADVADAADGVRRYLSLALPLHVADEEQSLTPRLREHAPATAAALDRMHAEHLEHEALIADVAERCAALAAAPTELATLAPALAGPASRLRAALALHLEEEERDLVPSIPSLPPEVQATIVAELRARRA